jgi:hypothetical protein
MDTDFPCVSIFESDTGWVVFTMFGDVMPEGTA